MNDIELLSPAGSFETALVAFASGADAVYLGLDAFSARAEAVNFSVADLRNLLAVARRTPDATKRVYVTFNTVVDDADIPNVLEKLAILEELRPDGLIVQDLGVARLVRRHFPALALHASTQLVTHNLEDVLALKELGFTRVVPARELTLAEIRSLIQRAGDMEFEIFVHGALCYSLSGLCLFSAMERNRSGNRGRCAYCCRLPYVDATGERSLPFSMRDLRLDESLDAIRDAGVASLKIEGRMKSPLYVASVTKRYRALLDGVPPTTSRADLETVFSRRTTTLYLNGRPNDGAPDAVIDPTSLGHLGTPIGTIKRLTKDREGRVWLRFHTNRALEKHDGLQFATPGGKPYGFGITDMRQALARTSVFTVPTNTDVEILVPHGDEPDPSLRPGTTVYCSASNEVKRRFPIPSFRPSDIASAGLPVDLTVRLTPHGLVLRAPVYDVTIEQPLALAPAQQPERTADAVRKALGRLGDTDWALGACTLEDPDRLFVPTSALNTARRALVAELDRVRTERRAAKIATLVDETTRVSPAPAVRPFRTASLKIRLDQPVHERLGDFDELVLAIGHQAGRDVERILRDRCEAFRNAVEADGDPAPAIRLALPVFTPEADFNTLRATVRHLVKAGFLKWEAADLATLRVLRELGLDDITADWTLYAFNRPALDALAERGVTRCVASPENAPANGTFLADSGFPVEFLTEQATPLFLSLTKPAAENPALFTGIRDERYAVYKIDNLWVTTRAEPRRFTPPPGTSTRLDRSWNRP